MTRPYRAALAPLSPATISFVNLDDTIVAIATPSGRGGIGVVRIAGPEARAIAAPMLRLKHDLEPCRAVVGELIDPCGRGRVAREEAPSARNPFLRNARAGESPATTRSK